MDPNESELNRYRSNILANRLSYDIPHPPTTLYGTTPPLLSGMATHTHNNYIDNPFSPTYGFDHVAAQQRQQDTFWNKNATIIKPILVLIIVAGAIYGMYWWLYKYPLRSNSSSQSMQNLDNDHNKIAVDKKQSSPIIISTIPSLAPINLPINNNNNMTLNSTTTELKNNDSNELSTAQSNDDHASTNNYNNNNNHELLTPILEEKYSNNTGSNTCGSPKPNESYDELPTEQKLHVMQRVVKKCYEDITHLENRLKRIELQRPRHLHRARYGNVNINGNRHQRHMQVE